MQPVSGPRPAGQDDWGDKPQRTRSARAPRGSQVIEEEVTVFGALRGSLDVGAATKAIRQSLDGTRRSQDQKFNVAKEASTAQRVSVEIARISHDIQRRSVCQPVFVPFQLAPALPICQCGLTLSRKIPPRGAHRHVPHCAPRGATGNGEILLRLHKSRIITPRILNFH